MRIEKGGNAAIKKNDFPGRVCSFVLLISTFPPNFLCVPISDIRHVNAFYLKLLNMVERFYLICILKNDMMLNKIRGWIQPMP